MYGTLARTFLKKKQAPSHRNTWDKFTKFRWPLEAIEDTPAAWASDVTALGTYRKETKTAGTPAVANKPRHYMTGRQTMSRFLLVNIVI